MKIISFLENNEISFILKVRCRFKGYRWKLENEMQLKITFTVPLTLSLLGYLKTRIRWGGGSFWPPPLNPVFEVQIWQLIHHWKALVLYFQNLQKNLQIFKNCKLFCKYSYKVKMFANCPIAKIVQKMKNYTFLKSPWSCHFKYARCSQYFI